jgi:hypothetical protein
MYRKSFLLISFVFMLSLVLTSATRADLVGWWRLDEGTGTTAYDSSGNGNDGTILGNPRWVAGKIGSALDFDGNGDYIDCGNDPIFNITKEITLAIWVNANDIGNGQHNCWMGKGDNTYAIKHQSGNNLEFFIYDGTWHSTNYTTNINSLNGEWHHMAGTYDGSELKFYLDGEMVLSTVYASTIGTSSDDVTLAENSQATGRYFDGMLDDARIYNKALPADDIKSIMMGGAFPYAYSPDPADGSIHADTWVTLSWKAGDFAVSHDIYLGDNLDDVNNAAHDSELFRGNQDLNSTFYVAGFPGFAYPDGLVNGTTYYWRIDEVNDANAASPWKGPVWSFTVPPKTAYSPTPADGAEFVELSAQLKWTPGYGAKLHYIVFGDDFDEVSSAPMGKISGVTSYNPGKLELAKTYYWRVDESDGFNTYTGDVWSFTTVGAVSGPNPADDAVDVKPTVVLKWNAGAVAASHEVYFGMDSDAVKSATKASPEYKGPKALGEESYDPGKLTLNTTYYWRIDEVNDARAGGPWAGHVWSFTTGDYFVIDDFEDYDAGENQIWYAWHDGLGYGAPGTPDYYAGNGTGAAVGDETTASYTEETIVHGGNQSMPIAYDNNKQGFSKYSQVDFALTNQRDWTEEGVANLSLWFRGYPASTGSFVENPAGTFTINGSGTDIWDVGPAGGPFHDEFHFAYKTLSGAGSITAKVVSVSNTDPWAKAGVMIRETLDGDSKHAMMVVTPGSGVSFQRRPETGGASADNTSAGITAPYWVKIDRSISGNFTASSSTNGTNWQVLGSMEPIQMGTNVYIGLAVTAHNATATCEGVFSNVTTTGNVTGQWAHQDIGIASNDAELLYVAVSNSAGSPAVVVNDDPAAAQINTWTEWVIPLSVFADQGINLTNVDSIAIGLGTQGNMTVPGGSGKIFIDDIRLDQPVEEPAE